VYKSTYLHDVILVT